MNRAAWSPGVPVTAELDDGSMVLGWVAEDWSGPMVGVTLPEGDVTLVPFLKVYER